MFPFLSPYWQAKANNVYVCSPSKPPPQRSHAPMKPRNPRSLPRSPLSHLPSPTPPAMKSLIPQLLPRRPTLRRELHPQSTQLSFLSSPLGQRPRRTRAMLQPRARRQQLEVKPAAQSARRTRSLRVLRLRTTPLRAECWV